MLALRRSQQRTRAGKKAETLKLSNRGRAPQLLAEIIGLVASFLTGRRASKFGQS